MPLIQPGQGSMPSKTIFGLMGMGDALESFVNSYKSEKDKAQDRADKQREFDLKQQELDATKENTKLIRQAQLRESLMATAEHIGQTAYDKIIANGGSEQDAMNAKELAIKQHIAGVVGNDPDSAQETYGSPMKDYMLANGKDTGAGGNNNKIPFDKPNPAIPNWPGNAMAKAQTQGGNPWALYEGGGALGLAAILNATRGNPVGQAIGTAKAGLGDLLNAPMGSYGGWKGVPTMKPGPVTPEEAQAAQGRFGMGLPKGGLNAIGGFAPGVIFNDLEDRLGVMQGLQALMNAGAGPKGQQQNMQDWQQSMQA